MSKLKVGVLFGGRSGEHEVSLVSATSVMEVLDKDRFDIIPVGITKQGAWLTGDAMRYLKSEEKEGSPERIIFVPAPGHRDFLTPDGRRIPGPDVIFPVLHGPYGEDGTLQGLLEMADVPYVGAGVLASSCCMDKVISKNIFERMGLPVVDYIFFTRDEWETCRPDILDDMHGYVGFPCFVKPANLGSSVGITKVRGVRGFERAVETALMYDAKVIVEQAVPKAREIEVSVLGNDDPKASVPGEIHPCNEFYDYDAKYVAGKTELSVPADLPGDTAQEIRALALDAFRALNCAGMARVDFLLEGDTDNVYVNEINTIPGFTSISMYPKLWEATGLPYPKLLETLIALAVERHEAKKGIRTSFELESAWYK
jgi:D-alanine-D-alanine ligase